MPDQDTLIAALRTVNDPELHVNVIDLGLIYSIHSFGRRGSRRDDVDLTGLSSRPWDAAISRQGPGGS